MEKASKEHGILNPMRRTEKTLVEESNTHVRETEMQQIVQQIFDQYTSRQTSH